MTAAPAVDRRATPRTLTGLWQRRSLAVDGGPAHEPAVVLWFQVGDRYLDIRATDEPGPLCGPGVFAGTTSWSEPAITWHHHLDSAHVLHRPAETGPYPDAADTGILSWDGDDLVERGSCTVDGTVVEYVEVWERLTPARAMAVATGHGSYRTDGGAGCTARIGHHRGSITVDPDRGGWAGVVEQQSDGGWSIVLTVGDDHLLPVTESAAP